MGSLHPVEQGLTVLLAVGPFVLLGIALRLAKRRDRAEDESIPTQTATATESESVGPNVPADQVGDQPRF